MPERITLAEEKTLKLEPPVRYYRESQWRWAVAHGQSVRYWYADEKGDITASIVGTT